VQGTFGSANQGIKRMAPPPLMHKSVGRKKNSMTVAT